MTAPRPPVDVTTWGCYVDPPEARVEPAGRWTYSVRVVHGLMSWGPDGGAWLVLGRRWARWKARRVLRRYLQDQAGRVDVLSGTAEDGR